MWFHVEATDNARPLLERIRKAGSLAGLAFNPETPLSAIEDCLDACDAILTMSVHPGFGGQKFETSALEKMRQLRARVAPDVLLAVDGGVNPATIEQCAQSGAQIFVVGSAIFGHGDYKSRVAELAELAGSHVRTQQKTWSKSY